MCFTPARTEVYKGSTVTKVESWGNWKKNIYVPGLRRKLRWSFLWHQINQRQPIVSKETTHIHAKNRLEEGKNDHVLWWHHRRLWGKSLALTRASKTFMTPQQNIPPEREGEQERLCVVMTPPTTSMKFTGINKHFENVHDSTTKHIGETFSSSRRRTRMIMCCDDTTNDFDEIDRH